MQAGKIAQQLRPLSDLSEDWGLVPITNLCGLQPPVTSAPDDIIP